MKHIEESKNIEQLKNINFISKREKRLLNILYCIILITMKIWIISSWKLLNAECNEIILR